MRGNTIHSSISKIIDYLDLDSSDLSELLNLSEQRVKSKVSDFSKLPVESILNMSDKLNIDFENLSRDQIDLPTLKEHYMGNYVALRDRYQKYQSSKFRTIKNVIDLLEPSNTYFVNCLIKKLQITRKHFYDLEGKVSGLLLQDIFKEMKKFGYCNRTFELLGFECSKKYKKILLDNVTGRITRSNLYSKVFDSIDTNLERNLKYTVEKVTNKATVISAVTREETKDILGLQRFGEPEHYLNIKGWLSGINRYIFDVPAKVTMLSSVSEFDQKCYYRIEHSQKHYH